MKHIPIAGTDLNPVCLCMGTHLMGSDVNERDSFAILDAYCEAGGNFLDTAHAYADWAPGCLHKNVSETTIGLWLRQRKNRDAFIVGTKGGYSSDGTPFSELLSCEALQRQIARSRACLQVDTIDLYWLHRDDPTRPVAHFIDFLNEHVEKKTIRHFGCSNWTAQRLQEAAEYAAKQGVKGFVANQMWWSLATPDLDAYNRSCNDTAVWQDTLTAADVTLPPGAVRYLEEG